MSNNKLQVTLLADEWKSSKGGLSTINRELAIQLAKHPNVSVTFLVPKCTEDDKNASSDFKVRIVEAQEKDGFDPIDWLSFPPDDLSINIIIGHGVKLGKYAQIIRKSHQCKWVQVVHTAPEQLSMLKTYSDCDNAISKGDIKQWNEIKLCQKADLVVAVGPRLWEFYSRYLNPSGKHVFNLTPGIFSEFSSLELSTVKRKKFNVLLFGRGDSEDFELKGFDLAAKAVAQLNDSSYQLVFVGAPSGNEKQVAEKLLGYGLRKSQLIVKPFLENREDLATLLSTADLAIIPSRSEGFGLTALEALSAGLPFLVTQTSGFGEALEDILPQSTPWVVDFEESDEWAEAIKSVREKGREAAIAECQTLRKNYGEKYTWESQCSDLVEKMFSLANAASRSKMESSVTATPSQSLNEASIVIPEIEGKLSLAPSNSEQCQKLQENRPGHFVGVDEGGNVVDIIDGDDNYKEDGDEVRDLNSRWERGKASLQFGEEISQSKIRVHLFNLADSYELEPVEDLLNKIAQLDRHHMCVEKHSFRRAKMSEMVDKIPTLEMDMAFFVVHAHEHRLLINEDKVGIGYTKIYRALLQATGGNVIIVIGGDDNYDGVDEENREVISRWAKRKVSSQFSIEYLDGRKSFIFSWNKQHRVIHEQALLHHFDPNKEGKEFDYQPCQLMEQNKPRTPPPLRSKEDPNRYRAVNCEERVGFIPYNYVKKQDPVEPKPMPWFHGNISTTEAERLLNPREDGMFLIRNSSTYKGDYALSVCYGHNIEYYRIMKKDDGKLTIDEEIFFGSLFEFVERFSSLTDGLCTTLAKPVYRGGKKIYAIDPRSFDKGGWEVDRSCLFPRDCIRRGDFGDIFQAEYHNQKVAVKIYSAERYQDVQAFLIEAAIMTDLQHRNIVTLLGVSSAQNPFYLVTEFCAKGNLLEFLSRTGSGSIKEDDLVRLAQDVAGGMRYLQSKDVVHRGLMARNILIHQDGTAKVSEFGLAQLPSLSSERKNTSDKWTAPEAIRRGIFSSQSDVWSYGVLLWVLFSVGENPYSNLPADHLVDEIERGYRMECPKGCNTVIYGMMSNCWHIDPKKRPNFKKIWGVLASFYYNLAPLEIRSRGRRALTAHKKALSEGRRFIKRVPIMLIGQDRSGKTSLAKSLKGERFNPEEDSTVGIHIDPSHFNLSTEIWKQGEKEDIYSVLWDFGGQAVYYTIHPLFLTSRAIYLLVNDLSRHLHHKAKSVMKEGMFTKSQDSFRFKTNADYLDFWMSSVASFAIQDESNSRETKSDLLPELPPVFLVCTHADKPFDGRDPRKLANEVFGHLQTKPYQNHIHGVFFVDNTKSGHELGCPEVLRLRQEIRAVAEELPHMKEAVPIKWLKFEEVMQAKKDEGNSWIFLEEAKETAWEVCNVSDDEEFRTLLDFFHDQRTLIHFDDTPELDKMVVLDVQWLVDVFKEVITIRPYDNKEKKFKKLWSRLEEEGVLEEPLLEHVWGPLYRKEDTCQSLLAIMEKFSLLCSWPSSDGSCGKQYLVPSMLMSHPPEEVMKLIASAKIPSLFIKFETGQVPPGLFPRLVLQVLQWCKEECTKPEHPQLFHNFVRIYSSEEVNCSIILLCHMSSIEVVVYKDDDGLEIAHGSKSAIGSPVSSNHDTFASVVLRKLELILEYMRKEFCWLQNMKYEMSFLCPVCCQGGAFRVCKRHSTEHCKREECLHFWPESELRSAKKARCTKYAAAETSKVPVKKLEPWFSPIRNQLTVDKCDGGNLASVEDDEETFSADEVLQIRLTQQRDDQTISPQLKGSLQLEGACPDTPDFESKSGETLPNLDKTNATTEIYLPDIVEKSLLSASCDAKEIVHLLKENLQLNKDFLERPDHDTKKIIRSLAQKAKDLKRLDVFEHLREITPAGTTGPLLPENLPVQHMPITKASGLSIRLAGGDEWMELAEGLGLTPEEIRFLDKRTLNPMEAALSFIAKQRFLSVGELYELLNERDFPLLADLL